MAKVKSYKPAYSRTRERVASVRTGATGSWRWTVDGVPGTLNSYNALNTNTKETTYDTVTPGYAQRVAAGEIISHSYTRIKRTLTGGNSGSIQVEWKDGVKSAVLDVSGFAFSDACGLYSASAMPVLPNYGPLIGYTQTKALAGVQQSQIQSLVSAGELRETLRMLVSPTRALLKWHENAKRRYEADLRRMGREAMTLQGKRRKAQLLSKIRQDKAARRKDASRLMDSISTFGHSAADMVLGYNLGWKPLISDIDKLLNEIPSLELQERRTSRASKEDEWETTASADRGTSYGINTNKVVTKTKVKVRAGINYEDGFEVSQHFGYRLSDVPGAVLELIPYSFLVNYIVNVQDYLSALRAESSMRALAMWTVIHVDSEATKTWDKVKTTIQHPGVNNVYGVVKSRDPGAPEVLHYEAKWRSVDPFGPTLTALQHPGAIRPPAQLQNVMSFLTKALLSLR